MANKIDIRQVAKKVDGLQEELKGLEQYTEGYLTEIGNQVFGVHVVQEVICEKLGITADEVEGHIKAKAEKMRAQEEATREAARSRLKSVPHTPETEGEAQADETPVEGADEAAEPGPV